jgi:hypothetical protein
MYKWLTHCSAIKVILGTGGIVEEKVGQTEPITSWLLESALRGVRDDASIA